MKGNGFYNRVQYFERHLYWDVQLDVPFDLCLFLHLSLSISVSLLIEQLHTLPFKTLQQNNNYNYKIYINETNILSIYFVLLFKTFLLCHPNFPYGINKVCLISTDSEYTLNDIIILLSTAIYSG